MFLEKWKKYWTDTKNRVEEHKRRVAELERQMKETDRYATELERQREENERRIQHLIKEYKLTRISKRALVAYIILCIEEALQFYGEKLEDWRYMLETLWAFTSMDVESDLAA